MIDRVLGAFERWQAAREPDLPRQRETTGIVTIACELKSSYLGEPNPADWSPHISAELVGQVLPRKIAGMDHDAATAVVPAMLTYFDFLVTTGRWKPHNDVEATRRTLSALEADLPARFGDPEQMSMAGRLMQLAVDEGVDITDPEALAGFTRRFNEMPDEWRKRLTDPPGLPAFNDEQMPGDDRLWDEDEDFEYSDDPEYLEALATASAAGVTAIGFDAADSVPITVPDARTELAALLATPLLSRMTALTEWVRPGRKLTSTMAMRRADTLEWARRFGVLGTTDSVPNSMWDWPELAAPWSIAVQCGLIDSSTTRAHPGEYSNLFHSTDFAAQIRCAREAIALLVARVIEADDPMSELDVAVIGLLLPLFAVLCRPEGADLAELRSMARGPADPAKSVKAGFADTMSRILFTMVVNIVDILTAWGILTAEAGRLSVPAALRPAVVQAINAPDAPFTITMEPGAVPVDE